MLIELNRGCEGFCPENQKPSQIPHAIFEPILRVLRVLRVFSYSLRAHAYTRMRTRGFEKSENPQNPHFEPNSCLRDLFAKPSQLPVEWPEKVKP